MKPIILIVALTGFTAAGSYGQNNASYMCTKKSVQYDVIPIAQDVPTTGKYIYYSEDTVQTQTFVPMEFLAPTESPACNKSTEGNLTVTKCPNGTYKSDNTNVYEYGTDGTYLGYYPVNNTVDMHCVKIEKESPTQHVAYKWAIPANANDQRKDCDPR